jgi:CHAD domain-containing protein
MMRELEAKLDVDSDYELPDLEITLTELRAEMTAPVGHTNVDIYHDTSDLRLLRWGCTLRHRQGHGWTVKLPAVAKRAGVGSKEGLERQEVNLGGRAGTPPPRARRLVASFSRGEPLEVVATITTRRTTHPVHGADGEPLLEISDDLVSAELGDGDTVTFRQVEVELAPDADPSALDPVVHALTSAGARSDAGDVKLAVALGRPELEPDVIVPPLPNRPASRQVIHRAIARSVRQLMLELPRARLGRDPEGIHQARVATRRLRSDLRTFKPLLDEDWVAKITPRLRELADDLGGVRDADVLHERLRNTIYEHPEVDPEAGGEVLELVLAQRAEAIDALDRYLNRVGTAQLLDELVAAATDPPTTAEADKPARKHLPLLVDKPWRRLDKAVGKLGKRPDVEDRHRVRILAKRARYATDAIKPAFGTKSRRFAKSLAGLQDTMGDLNDAVVAEAWLNRYGPGLSPQAAYAAGRLAEVYSTMAVADDDWRRVWSRVQRRRPRWLTG